MSTPDSSQGLPALPDYTPMRHAGFSDDDIANIAGQSALTDTDKLDYLYRIAIKVESFIDKFTPEDTAKVQKTMANPIVKKLLGL